MSNRSTRSKQSVEGDKAALRAWVRHLQSQPGRSGIKLRETSSRLTLTDDEIGEVAAFVLNNDRWALKWMRKTERWAPYDDKTYLTLAIPMLLVDQDEFGCFLG